MTLRATSYSGDHIVDSSIYSRQIEKYCKWSEVISITPECGYSPYWYKIQPRSDQLTWTRTRGTQGPWPGDRDGQASLTCTGPVYGTGLRTGLRDHRPYSEPGPWPWPWGGLTRTLLRTRPYSGTRRLRPTAWLTEHTDLSARPTGLCLCLCLALARQKEKGRQGTGTSQTALRLRPVTVPESLNPKQAQKSDSTYRKIYISYIFRKPYYSSTKSNQNFKSSMISAREGVDANYLPKNSKYD